MKLYNLIAILLFTTIMLAGCGNSKNHNTHDDDDDHTDTDAFVFTKKQQQKTQFAVEDVRIEPFDAIIRTAAQVLPSQGDEKIVTAKAGGTVAFSTDFAVAGKAVKAGQYLFSIESSELTDNNLNIRYVEAENEYMRAKKEYERKLDLEKDKIVSKQDLIKAETEYKNAENIYNNLRKSFSGGKQTITAPISGYITTIFVRNGEYVETGQPVLVISQNSSLFIRAELSPKYFSALGNITSANIRIMNTNKTYSLEELNGKLLSFGKSADISNPLIPVVFQINNSIDLLSGSVVELYIKTQTSKRAITVSNEAIIEEMGSYFVFVELSDETFEKRMVTKGKTDGLRTEITDGLSAGEHVVSKGAILIKLTQSTEELDVHSGHSH
ncbi:MAG: efflux RND transporter periplasmic adaptor subunit [Prevotellaceae bacterium]|jgi:RND family efflux transporter MFP subunit|nr:efflux RND transporter periplasmic adaptor subunit [Prevotellaceae bacterium]